MQFIAFPMRRLNYEFLSDWLEAVQAFSILGAVALIIALVLLIVVLFVKDNKVLKLIVWVLAFVAGR